MEPLKLKDCGSICQLALFLLVTVTGGAILIIGLMMNSKYGPQAVAQPLYIRLNSLSVSNLNPLKSISSAHWDANLLFENRYGSFEISIQMFKSFIYYNDHQDDALSCALVEGIHLGPREQKLVEIKLNASGCGKAEELHVEDGVVREINRVIGDNGILHLGLEMDFVQVAYKKGPWTWVYELNPRCSDLDVMLVKDKGTGSMATDKPRVCLVPSLK